MLCGKVRDKLSRPDGESCQSLQRPIIGPGGIEKLALGTQGFDSKSFFNLSELRGDLEISFATPWFDSKSVSKFKFSVYPTAQQSCVPATAPRTKVTKFLSLDTQDES